MVAKLGKQTAILYEEVYRALTSNATLATHFDKSWLTHTLGKSQYYDIQASYRQSLAHHEKEEIGLAIAFVRQVCLSTSRSLLSVEFDDSAPLLTTLFLMCPTFGEDSLDWAIVGAVHEAGRGSILFPHESARSP